MGQERNVNVSVQKGDIGYLIKTESVEEELYTTLEAAHKDIANNRLKITLRRLSLATVGVTLASIGVAVSLSGTEDDGLKTVGLVGITGAAVTIGYLTGSMRKDDIDRQTVTVQLGAIKSTQEKTSKSGHHRKIKS